jgi:glycosyltransferase involved in cell wall biosynthesis
LKTCVVFHEGELQGAGLAVQRLLPGLRETGWRPNAWYGYEGPLLPLVDPLVDGSRFAQNTFGFSVRGWRAPPGPTRRAANLPRYWAALRRWLAEVEPDVVHANTLLSIPEATVARAMGFPVVLHVHESPPPGAKSTVTFRWGATAADVVVTCAQGVADLVAPHAGDTPVRTVYNGMAPAAFADPRTDHGPDAGGRIVVGMIGALAHVKGADIFLDAVERVIAARDDVDVLHVGGAPWGTEDYRAAVQAQMDALPADRVTFAGVQPSAPLLRKMNILVSASRQESFALVSLEAMAAGIPVIAPSVGGFPEQLTDDRTGVLVPPADADALAAAILALAADPARRERLAIAARDRVARHFTLDAQVAGVEAAYREALDRATAAGRRRAHGRMGPAAEEAA